MKKSITLLYIIILFLFIPKGNLYAQWVAQTAPTGTTNIYSVYALSPTAVACSGSGQIIYSSNGGTVWTMPVSFGGYNNYSIHSGTNYSWYSLTNNSTLEFKISTNGNLYLYGGKPDSIMALHFNSTFCATAVGIAGIIKTTCDSGDTWQTRATAGLQLNSVWYANTNIGVACGVFGNIKRTLNGGVTWTSVINSSTQNLNSVTFADTLNGYIVGNAGTFLKTTDGGATWTSLPLGITNNLNGVYFTSVDTGYVVGSGGLIKQTVNGGTSWTTMTSGTTQTLHSVYFANSATGWVCGDGAVILKYCPTLSVTGNITGTSTVCVGDTVTYTIPTVTGASGYTWTAPGGWSGVSTTNTITYVAGYTSGNITAAADNACGSGVPATLAITNNTPAIPVITQSGYLLTSSAATGNQWYLNGTAIPGATSQSYTFTSNGTYTVRITSSGCTATSLPHNITNAAVNELSQSIAEYTVYPNPANGLLNFTILNTTFTTIKLMNLLGDCIQQLTTTNKQVTMDVSGIDRGIYFIQLLDDHKNVVNKKIVLE